MNNQSGGMDPGLAALVAAILSGSMTAYGVSVTNKKANVEALDAAAAKANADLETLKSQAAESSQHKAIAEGQARRIQQLEAEVKRLESERDKARMAASSETGPALVFKKATSEALGEAVNGFIDRLKDNAKYAYLVSKPSYVESIKKVLEYPTTYRAKLSRMSLPDFYFKQVQPVFKQVAMDASRVIGGRGKRYRKFRKGGDAYETDELLSAFNTPAEQMKRAAASGDIPSYEEFAEMYGQAIDAATATMPTYRQKMDAEFAKKTAQKKDASEKKALEKKDAAAKKAADTIIPKLDAAIKAGEEALAIVVPEGRKEELRPLRIKLGEKLDAARELVGNPEPGTPKKRFGIFGGASNLREVKTEAEWLELNTPTAAKDLLEDLKTATKEYTDAVNKPSITPEEPMVMVDNPMYTPNEDPGTPSSQVIPVDTTDFSVVNPLRLAEARESQEAELAAEPLRKPTRRKSPFSRGGKARKRTLKKRRGGK